MVNVSGVQRQFEAIGVLFQPHRMKAAGEDFGIAKLAALRDFVAAGGGVPGLLGPFYGGLCH